MTANESVFFLYPVNLVTRWWLSKDTEGCLWIIKTIYIWTVLFSATPMINKQVKGQHCAEKELSPSELSLNCIARVLYQHGFHSLFANKNFLPLNRARVLYLHGFHSLSIKTSACHCIELGFYTSMGSTPCQLKHLLALALSW